MQDQQKVPVGIDSLVAKLKDYRGKGKIGIIFGSFDVLHIGHIKFIRWAKKRCNILVLALASDALVKANKGAGRPIFTQEKRAEVLSAISEVDFILKMDNPGFANQTPEAQRNIAEIIDKIRPDLLIVGEGDNSFEAKKEYAKSRDIKFIKYKEKRETSSSKTIKKIETLEN